MSTPVDLLTIIGDRAIFGTAALMREHHVQRKVPNGQVQARGGSVRLARTARPQPRRLQPVLGGGWRLHGLTSINRRSFRQATTLLNSEV